MVAVDAGEVGDRIDPAEVEHQHRAGHGVLLVIAEGGFDEELLADEAGRRVARLAGFTRRAQSVESGANGRRPGVERDLDELFGAVDLGMDLRLHPGTDVALNAVHTGVRRYLVRGPLRRHHMAGLAAEVG